MNGGKKMESNKIYINGILRDCERCRGSAEMLITITNNVKDPNAKSKWLGGHLPAIYCPFCGRKLRKEDGK